MEANGILHWRVLPYHPASNGAAENLVKRSLEKDKATDSLEMRLAEFLSMYRNTPQEDSHRNFVGKSSMHLVNPCLSQTLLAKAEDSLRDKSSM